MCLFFHIVWCRQPDTLAALLTCVFTLSYVFRLLDASISKYSKLITCSIGWSFSASLHRIGSLRMVIDLVFGIEMLMLYLFAVWLNSNYMHIVLTFCYENCIVCIAQYFEFDLWCGPLPAWKASDSGYLLAWYLSISALPLWLRCLTVFLFLYLFNKFNKRFSPCDWF